MGIIVSKQPYVKVADKDPIYNYGVSYKDGMCSVPTEKKPYYDYDRKSSTPAPDRRSVGADAC